MFIGIDVGSEHLDLATTTTSPLPRRVPNTDAGRAALATALQTLDPTLIVLEATGTYHRRLLATLLVAELPVSVINPAQSAAFRKQHLGRNTTDRGDAKLLARFAELHHAQLRRAEPQDPDLAQLRRFVGYREDLVARQTQASNQRHAAEAEGDVDVLAWLAADLAEIAARLKTVEKAIRQGLKRIPDSGVLMEQIGVGATIASVVLASLPAGVHGNAKAAAAYAGVHPRQE